jgi:hypothetical protein
MYLDHGARDVTDLYEDMKGMHVEEFLRDDGKASIPPAVRGRKLTNRWKSL